MNEITPEGSPGEFAGVDLLLLAKQHRIAQLLHGLRVGRNLNLVGMFVVQLVGLVESLVENGVGIGTQIERMAFVFLAILAGRLM